MWINTFGHLRLAGISKPSILGVSEYYENLNLNERFHVMPGYIQELRNLFEAYRQQVKEARPPPTDKFAIALDQETGHQRV